MGQTDSQESSYTKPIEPFSVERFDDLRAATVRIACDIDIAVVPQMSQSLVALLETGTSNFVLDLSEVRFIDSSALGFLVYLDRMLRDREGSVVLTGVDKNVGRVLDLSGILGGAKTLTKASDASRAIGSLEAVPSLVAPLWEDHLEMPARTDALPDVRRRIGEILEPLNLPEDILFDIKVASGEALANAVRHGSAEKNESIGIGIRVYEDRIVIEVADVGVGFDGSVELSDDLYSPGGRGIMFMNALMDTVSFSPGSTGGTIVTLEKRRTISGF